MHQDILGVNLLESNFTEKASGAAGGQAEHEAAMYPCDKEGKQPVGLLQEECCPQVRKGDVSPLPSTRETRLGVVPRSGLPDTRETQTYGSNSDKEPQR